MTMPRASSAATRTDAIGVAHGAGGREARIVCLVPSITELLFALGLGGQVVGRTGFCEHPKPAVRKVPKVGGTKDFDLEKLRALRPTHLIVNIDENPKQRVDAAAQFVPDVVVTHPMGPLDNPPLYRLLGGIFGVEDAAERLATKFEAAYAAAVAATKPLARERVLYLIWKQPWMTIAGDTYIARVLQAVGWDQIEVAGDGRYPTVELASVLDRVDRILLSSEPYAFTRRDLQSVESIVDSVTRHPSRVTVSLIDAQMTSWYGSRAIEGMRYLAAQRAA
jgi:ABC-type Fe3+-hydroxamate transport system substrate-binding protein